MPSSLRRILALVVLALAACSSPEEAPSLPPDTNRMQEGFAPTPYTADEIRAHCGPGRTMVFLIEASEQPATLRVFHFLREDDSSPLFQVWTTDLDGNLIGEIESVTPVWAELQGHASFSEERTTLELGEVTAPFGTYPCYVYTVRSERDGESYVQRYHFACKLPGPPLLMEIEQGGRIIHRMTMIEDDSASRDG